jgi:hypothetical protein
MDRRAEKSQQHPDETTLPISNELSALMDSVQGPMGAVLACPDLGHV